MNKEIQVSILSIFIATALFRSVAAVGNNMAFADVPGLMEKLL
jgi:hypothetical protein